MKIRRHHLIIAAVVLLGLTFLVIGVLSKQEHPKYYAHSLRNYQESDSVPGYPIPIASANDDQAAPEFLTTEFEPNLSSLTPMERYRLPIAHGFAPFPDAAAHAHAAGTGLVLYTGDPAGYDGLAVLLGHRLPDGSIVQTFYHGLTKILVQVGQHVPRGTLLGPGQISFEGRLGTAIDIAQATIADHALNSQSAPMPPNRLTPAEFFAKFPPAPSTPDPLALIEEARQKAARQKLGFGVE